MQILYSINVCRALTGIPYDIIVTGIPIQNTRYKLGIPLRIAFGLTCCRNIFPFQSGGQPPPAGLAEGIGRVPGDMNDWFR